MWIEIERDALHLFVAPVSPFKDFNFHLGDPSRVKSEALSASNRDVYNATFPVGTPIRDDEDFRFPIEETGHPDFGAKRKGFMSGGVGPVREAPSACRSAPAVGFDTVPGRDAVIGLKDRMVSIVFCIQIVGCLCRSIKRGQISA